MFYIKKNPRGLENTTRNHEISVNHLQRSKSMKKAEEENKMKVGILDTTNSIFSILYWRSGRFLELYYTTAIIVLDFQYL